MGALLAYQEEKRVELLNGKIVAMSPSPSVNHNIVVVNITHIIKTYLKNKSCKAFADGVDVHLTEKDTVIPDVMVVCNKDIIKKNGIHGAPDLIVEVLSPSTVKNDKGYKKDLYEKYGIKEYWIVDTESCFIEVYLLKNNKYILDEVYSIFPDYLIEKMTDAEKDSIIHEFSPSIFPELTISIDDVFEGMLE